MSQVFAILPDVGSHFKKQFLQIYPDITSFTYPGERFVHDALGYKRKLLAKFKEAMPEERLRTLLDENKGRQVLKKMAQCSGNLSNFTGPAHDLPIIGLSNLHLKKTSS